MNGISVSLILTTWNGDKTLKKAISSLKEQSYNFINFFVSDDASTDKSKEIINSQFKNKQNCKILFRKNNIGGWKNFISQVKNSKDVYLCWVCQDDEWHKDFVKELVECAISYERKYGNLPSIVGCGTILQDNGKVLLKKSLKKYDLSNKNSIQLAKAILIGKKELQKNQ